MLAKIIALYCLSASFVFPTALKHWKKKKKNYLIFLKDHFFLRSNLFKSISS